MERYRFFDSIDGEDEREYTADEFAEYFRQFIRNGIFTGGENLKVETDEQDMKVFIKPGYAWIEGYLYKIDTEPLVIQHNIADPSLNRIDRIVIRLDKTLENRYVKAFILEGTPAETPQVPELTRNSNVYEISLAQIEIIAGKSFIEAYQITDERLNNDVCGIATHLFEQVDTTDIFNEWQNYLNYKRNESDLNYETFVTAYKNTWNSWIEDKISEPGGEFYAEWKAWFNEIEDTTNLVTLSQFNNHKENKNNPHNVTVEQIGAETPEGSQAKVDALAGEGNTKTVKELDNELKSHKSDTATKTELGHVRVDGETIRSNNGILSVAREDAKSIKGIEVDNLTGILDGDTLVYDSNLGKFIKESSHPTMVYDEGDNRGGFSDTPTYVYLESESIRLRTLTSSRTTETVTEAVYDFSKMNTLYIEWSYETGGYLTGLSIVDHIDGSYRTNNLAKLEGSCWLSAKSRQVESLDVSNLYGFYRIAIYRYQDGQTHGSREPASGNTYFYRIWGER